MKKRSRKKPKRSPKRRPGQRRSPKGRPGLTTRPISSGELGKIILPGILILGPVHTDQWGRSTGASASTATGAAAFAGQWYQTYQYDPASDNAVSKTTIAGSASLIASQLRSARGDSVCAVNVATVSETSFIDSAPFMMMILIVACVLVGVIVLCLAKSRFERQLADKVSKMQQTANQEKERMEQMEQHQERLEAALAAAEAAVAASTRTQTRAGEPKSKARARAQSAPVPTRTMAVQSQCTYSSVRSTREHQISQPRFEFLQRGEDGAFVM